MFNIKFWTIGPFEEATMAKHWIFSTQPDEFLGEIGEPKSLFFSISIDPTDLIILTIAIVIAALRPAKFIPRQQHGRALG
jgi:hypothetical protein